MWCNNGEVLGLTGIAGMGFWLGRGGGEGWRLLVGGIESNEE